MNAPVLFAEGVRKRFDATQALSDGALAVAAGETHGLVGANGAGKSTLVKILSGALRPDEGTIGIGEWRGDHTVPHRAQELGLATIYQEPDLVPTLGLTENVMLGRERTRLGVFVSRRRERTRAREFLSLVGLDDERAQRGTGLTPAEQQLLELAKALQRNARVIIMDEPTAALGAADTDRLFEVIANLRSQGVSVLYISHRLDEVLSICDRVTIMRDGAHVRTAPVAELDENRIVEGMIGRRLERSEYSGLDKGPLRLSVRELGQGSRLDGISFDLRAGEVLGITGQVGSGRTRLIQTIFGVQPFDRGRIALDGESYQPSSPRAAIRRGLGLIPEDRKLDGLQMQMSVAQNVTLVRPVAARGGLLNLRKERRTASEWIDRLAITPRNPVEIPAHLSGGNQQKVAVARWLHADVSLLIFDEPGQGVDVGAKQHILDTIRDLAREGKAILVVSQELEELCQVADRVLVMHRGRIAAELRNEELEEERVVALSMGIAENEERRTVTQS